MKKYLLLIVLCCLVLSSCFLKKQEDSINLSVFENIAPGNEWVMLTDPYAPFYAEPSKKSHVTSHGRKGDILELKGKKLLKESEKQVLWYEFENGWLDSNGVLIFSNKIQAENASKQALQ